MKKKMSIAMSRSSDIDEMESQLRNLGKPDEGQKNKYRLRKEKLGVLKKALEERKGTPRLRALGSYGCWWRSTFEGSTAL
jgi:hypothetical protein